MAGDWLWARRTPTQSEFAAATAPTFERRYFDQYCHEARMELELLVDADVLPGRVYDARLEVIARTFVAFAEGHCDYQAVVSLVHEAVASMRNNPPAAVLGCELAKAGFLAMHQPQMALQYANLAARIFDQFGLQPEQAQTPNRRLLAPGP